MRRKGYIKQTFSLVDIDEMRGLIEDAYKIINKNFPQLHEDWLDRARKFVDKK